MSYDIWMTIEPAPDRFTTYLDLGNMTSNCARMWRLACPETDGLAGIHGKTGAEVAAHLLLGVVDMRSNRDKYEALAPANGWGSYHSGFKYLLTMAKAARDFPSATFHVCR